MKLLVVEDNKNFAETLKIGLTQEGHIVEVATDGEAGLRELIARSSDYDLVVLDVMLPKKSGLEVCTELRANNIMLPIIMLTARDTVSDKILGLDAGADDYVVKPFAFAELLARIRALSRRPKEAAPAIIKLGDITLNNATKELTIKGKAVALTFREFSLLEYFMRHPNHVLSRGQILSHVWDYSFDGFSNVVDAHIKNVRKKLGVYGKSLETLRGMGYRFTV